MRRVFEALAGGGDTDRLGDLVQVERDLVALAGELPLAVGEMKAKGVTVLLDDNMGLTLPTNMEASGRTDKLDLSNCFLTG